MERKVRWSDLRQIRKAVETLTDSSGKGNRFVVSIVLPEPCDKETQDYANTLCYELGKVNCCGQISEVLFFSAQEAVDKNFEVMPTQPLGLPCIRVYPQGRGIINKVWFKTIYNWAYSLLSSLRDKLSNYR